MTEIDNETREMIRKLSAYFETPEGEEHMKKVRAAVESLIKDLEKQEEVTPEQLLQKVTI